MTAKRPYVASVTIDEDGNEQVWLAHYWRYHSPDHYEADSPEEAQRFLSNGQDYGALSSCCIVWPDGRRRPYNYVDDTLGDFEPWDAKHCPPRAVTDARGSGREP